MKKIITLVVGFLLTIMKLSNYDGILTKEINMSKISFLFAENFYTSDLTVGNTDIEVLDYHYENEYLYVEPQKKEVILPISGIVSEIGKDYILITDDSYYYYIYNISNRKYNLYQYYTTGSILGNSDEYMVITNNEGFINNLSIRYEEI